MTRKSELQEYREWKKTRRRQGLSALLMGMLGAALWEHVGKKIWNRIPVPWRIAGCVVFGLAFLMVEGFEWAGWGLLVLAAGLILDVIRRRRHRGDKSGISTIVEQWAQIVEENPTLHRVLRGSRLRVLEADATGFTLCIELAGGHTPDEVHMLTPNLESVFHTPPDTLRVYGDPTGRHRVLVRAGDARPGTQKPPEPRTEPGPIIDVQPLALPPSGEWLSRARVFTRGRARTSARGPVERVSETVRVQELKRRAELARQKGERTHKGGRRRSA